MADGKLCVCPQCGKKFKLKAGFAAKSFACTACSATVWVEGKPPAPSTRRKTTSRSGSRSAGRKSGRSGARGASPTKGKARAAAGGQRRGGGRRDEGADDEREERRTRYSSQQNNNSTNVVIAVVGLLLIVGVVLFFVMSGDDKPDDTTIATNPASKTNNSGGGDALDATGDGSGGASGGGEGGDGCGGAAGAANATGGGSGCGGCGDGTDKTATGDPKGSGGGEIGGSTGCGPGAQTKKNVTTKLGGKTKKKRGKGRWAPSADLAHLKDTPEELRKQIDDLIAVMMDPFAGRDSNDAKRKLVAIGKPAFPRVLGAMAKVRDTITDVDNHDERLIESSLMLADGVLREMDGYLESKSKGLLRPGTDKKYISYILQLHNKRWMKTLSKLAEMPGPYDPTKEYEAMEDDD